MPNDSELWFVHLAVRPQVNLHSIGRKRFAHLSDLQVKYDLIFHESIFHPHFPFEKKHTFWKDVTLWFDEFFFAQDEIHVEENVPWGEDTLFTLEFREEANKYSIHTCNNMYLQRDGKLVPAVNKVCYSRKYKNLVKTQRIVLDCSDLTNFLKL